MTRRRPPVSRWPHQVNVRVSTETMEALERIADAESVPLAHVARDALERGLGAAAKASAGRRGRPG